MIWAVLITIKQLIVIKIRDRGLLFLFYRFKIFYKFLKKSNNISEVSLS